MGSDTSIVKLCVMYPVNVIIIITNELLDSVPTATNQQVDDDNSSESESESETDHFTMTVSKV